MYTTIEVKIKLKSQRWYDYRRKPNIPTKALDMRAVQLTQKLVH